MTRRLSYALIVGILWLAPATGARSADSVSQGAVGSSLPTASARESEDVGGLLRSLPGLGMAAACPTSCAAA